MDSSQALAGIANVSAMLVREGDLSGILSAGMQEAARVLGADGAGVIVVVPGNAHLEVLASTSHEAADLAAYQAATSEGPCVDCIRDDRPVEVRSADEAEERWPSFGAMMRDAGYERAFSIPMRWQGDAVGGLHFFWRRTDGLLDELVTQVTQTFADVLTIAVVHVQAPTLNVALERVQAALAARGVIEQAKGVLSHQRNVDMGAAYQHLLTLAEQRRVTLGRAARMVVESAQAGESL
jgi:GAF domain-containing protein